MVRLIKNPELFRMIRQGMAGAMVLCAAFAGSALAQTTQTGVTYRLSQNMRDPTYRVALQYMESMYKKDPWHWDGAEWLHNPMIGLGDTYLNADQYPEIIAYPTEDEEETGKFCEKDGRCPHFVLEVRGDGDGGIRRLAKITAYTITRDDKNANGYWNLRVYTKDPAVDPNYYEIYAYDPKKDAYAPAPK